MTTNAQIPAILDANADSPEELAPSGDYREVTAQRLRSLGVLSARQVDRIVEEEASTPFLVDGFLPVKSIAIVGGDSTIGKSPLMLQLALAVAAGRPFLRMSTRQGRVLYFDLENAVTDWKMMRDALVRFIGLDEPPDDLLLATDPPAQARLEELIAEVRPQLVVIDSIRSFRPEITDKNVRAGEFLKEIRRLSRTHACAFVLVHHLRKPDLNMPHLDGVGVATWLLDMEGPRAFVNQTDIRVAVAEGDYGSNTALQVKWSRRVHGDSPLVLLERVHDESGEPAGYRPLTGAALLSPQRRAALENLGPEFSFKEAMHALGRSDDPTNKFLHETMQLRLVEKIARGRYRKTTSTGDRPVIGRGEGPSA